MSKGKGYAVEEVGEKGEVVIGDEFLEELGIKPGWRAFQFMGDGYVKIYFAPPKNFNELAGSLSNYDGPGIPADADWGKIRDESWTWAVENDF